MTTSSLVNSFESIVEKSENRQLSGEEIGIFARLFGCWHTRLSRPFVDGKIVYRSCLRCGARRLYDPKTLRSYGNFYYPSVKQD